MLLKKAKKMRFLRQSLIGFVLAALSLGFLAYAAQIVGDAVQTRMAKETKVFTPRERIFGVGVVRALSGIEKPILESFGEIKSRRTLELRAATAGRVIMLSEVFEDGGMVESGENLVKIDPADAQAEFERAEADMLDAEAEVRDAERSIALARDEEAAAQEQAVLRQSVYARQVDLAERGVGTSTNIETAELAAAAARQSVLSRRQAVSQAEGRIDQAKTRLVRARIALKQTERELMDTTLQAPFSGTLSETNVVKGRLVSANEKLAVLIDPNALEVSFRVSTAQYARLLNVSGAIISAPIIAKSDVFGIDLSAKGTISRASAAVGEGQTGRLVFARLGQSLGFKPGDFVTVNVQEPPLDDVVRLPASAIDSSNTVLVIDEENRLESVSVELVRRQGDDVLVRAEGLSGRDVVEARSPLLGVGVLVRPLLINDASIRAEPEMLELSAERRASLIAFVEKNQNMPDEAKARTLANLRQTYVPAEMVARLESRMGG